MKLQNDFSPLWKQKTDFLKKQCSSKNINSENETLVMQNAFFKPKTLMKLKGNVMPA